MALTRSDDPTPKEHAVSKWWFVQVDDWSLHRVRPRRFLPRGTCTFGVGLCDHVYHLTSEQWVGIWCSGVRLRGPSHVAHGQVVTPFKRPIVKRKQAAAAAGDGARHLASVETELFKDHMPLVEHMAMVRYDDGDPRQAGWVMLKTLGAAWIVAIKDPDSGNSFQFVAETLDKAIDGATLLLACDDAPWQPDAYLKAGKRK